MCRVRWYHLALMLMSIPRSSTAIQLRWSSGPSDLTLSAARRCTLVVQADAQEQRLPPSWRLIWVASGASIQPLALGPLAACAGTTAQVSAIVPPTSPADSADHAIIAAFCSVPTGFASTAHYLLDLPADAQGKLKVAALDTMGLTPRVVESQQVTFNGGVVDPYPPVVLGASSIHQSLELRVTALGSGLSAASSMSLLAADSSWTLPLAVMSRTDTAVTGTTSVAALVPACQARVGSESGAVSGAGLAADQDHQPEDPQSCQAQYFEELLQPPPSLHGYTIQPKDFAFTRGFVDPSSNRFALHLFHIRHNYWYDDPANPQPGLNERNIGHKLHRESLLIISASASRPRPTSTPGRPTTTSY